jgi:hypothetical protein
MHKSSGFSLLSTEAVTFVAFAVRLLTILYRSLSSRGSALQIGRTYTKLKYYCECYRVIISWRSCVNYAPDSNGQLVRQSRFENSQYVGMEKVPATRARGSGSIPQERSSAERKLILLIPKRRCMNAAPYKVYLSRGTRKWFPTKSGIIWKHQKPELQWDSITSLAPPSLPDLPPVPKATRFISSSGKYDSETRTLQHSEVPKCCKMDQSTTLYCFRWVIVC